MEEEPKEPQTGNDNLAKNKVNVEIDPNTDRNKVNISLCSFTLTCFNWHWSKIDKEDKEEN